MAEHMDLARIPEGEEYDYVCDMVQYLQKRRLMRDSRLWGFGLCSIPTIGMWRAVFIGVKRAFCGEVSFFSVVLLAVIAAGFTAMIVVGGKSSIKPYDVLVDFNSVKVWDVEVVDIVRNSGRGKRYFAKAKYSDGSISEAQFQLELYPKEKYKKSLVVVVNDYGGKEAQIKLIPSLDD